MVLDKKIIHDMVNVSGGELQVVIDEDYNVPDTRQDIEEILATRGNVRLEEIRLSDGRLSVKGSLDYGLLYRGENPDGLEGSIGFNETINLREAAGVDMAAVTPRCEAVLEVLDITLIHSRKINVRSVVTLKGRLDSDRELSLPVEKGEEALLVKREELNCVRLVADAREVRRIRKVMELPAGKPDIGQVVYSDVDVCLVTSQPEEDGLHIELQLVLSVLYRSVSGDEYVWLRMTERVEQVMDVSGLKPEAIAYVTLNRQDCRVGIRADDDGEDRCLEVDMGVELFVQGYEEKNENVIVDCYIQGKNVETEYGEELLCDRIFRNAIRCRTQKLYEDESMREFRICTYMGVPRVEDVSIVEGQLEINGVLEVQVIGLKPADSGEVLSVVRQAVPFSQTMDVSALKGNVAQDGITWQLNAALERLNVSNSLQGLEFKAVVSLDVLLKGTRMLQVLRNAVVGELDREWYMSLPQMTGYIVGRDEDLWDIARNNHTTVEDIIECNRLAGGSVRENDRLVIMRKPLW
jgi:hypothetical protein